MKNIRFYWYNLVDLSGTTITSNSEDSDYPLTNIQNRWHTRVYRTTDVSTEWIKFDFGSAQDIEGVIIKNHNFTNGATIKAQLNATDSWGSPSVDETMTYNDETMAKLWDTAQSYRWCRISMADAGNGDGYLQAGRIFIGGAFSPTINFSRAYVKEIIDPSDKEYSTGRQVSVNEKDTYKVFRYDFDYVEDPDQDNFVEIFEYVGQKKGYFIVQDADDWENTTYYVENVSNWSIEHISTDTYFRTGIDVAELA